MLSREINWYNIKQCNRKIKIIVSTGLEHDNLSLQRKTIECDSYEKIIKVDSEQIDYKTYTFIKALEKNKQFENQIKKIRDKIGIPREGFTKKEYDSFRESHKIYPTKKSGYIGFGHSDKFNEINKIIRNESLPIITHFNLNDLIASSIKYLVFHNGIYAPNRAIYLDDNKKPLPLNESTNIKIVIQSKVSKNKLIKFIKENFKQLEEAMEESNLPEDVGFYISRRDWEIVNIRDQKKWKYRKIADYISKEYDDFDINEDSVKTAYDRAKKKILSLNL